MTNIVVLYGKKNATFGGYIIYQSNDDSYSKCCISTLNDCDNYHCFYLFMQGIYNNVSTIRSEVSAQGGGLPLVIHGSCDPLIPTPPHCRQKPYNQETMDRKNEN